MNTNMHDNELLTPAEAARLLRTTAATLATWRWAGRGPSYCRVGRSIKYPRHLIDDYLANSTVTHEPAAV